MAQVLFLRLEALMHPADPACLLASVRYTLAYE